MFTFCPLASGSKGNCLFVGGKTRVLIDAGLSVAETLARLSQIGVDAKTIEAILITHDHIDHIKGVVSLSHRLRIPVLANSDTAKGIVSMIGEKPQLKIFTTGESFQFGDLTVHPFSVPHDTLDPVGFTIVANGFKLGVCADLGHATSLVKKCLEKCDLLYVEANHEPQMVHASNRPRMLKERILGRQGHLSNSDCAELIAHLLHENLQQIYLAHLSGECNAPERALEVVRARIGDAIPIEIAYQHQVSSYFNFRT